MRQRADLGVVGCGGFSLIEVLFSLSILALGLSMITSFFVRGQLSNQHSRRRLVQTELAKGILADFRFAAVPRGLSGKLVPCSGVPNYSCMTEAIPGLFPAGLQMIRVTVLPPVQGPSVVLSGVVPASKVRYSPKAKPGAAIRSPAGPQRDGASGLPEGGESADPAKPDSGNGVDIDSGPPPDRLRAEEISSHENGGASGKGAPTEGATPHHVPQGEDAAPPDETEAVQPTAGTNGPSDGPVDPKGGAE